MLQVIKELDTKDSSIASLEEREKELNKQLADKNDLICDVRFIFTSEFFFFLKTSLTVMSFGYKI